MTCEEFEDLDKLAPVLASAFPELQHLLPLSVLGRGFRSLALETAGGDVIRVGLSPDAEQDYSKERRISDFLAAHLGALVPRPLWHTEARAGLPYGAIVYRKLAGETPPWGIDPGEDFSRDLGEFMARLHRLPSAEARAAGIPKVDSYARVLGAREVVMPVLSSRLDRAALSRVETWWEEFTADARARSERIAVCHHDLWHDNLLQSESKRLSGVLDIAHIELTDPAHDFAAPQYFGEAFMTRLISSYRAAGADFDQNDLYRSRRFYEAREFGGLAWAIEHDDQTEVDDSIEKVLRGPLFAAP